MIRLLTLLLALPWAASAAAGTAPAAEQARYVMGTTVTVQAWAADPGQAALAVEEVFGVFARIDSLMSTWRRDSVLSSLNRAEAGQWVTVGPEVCRVLAEAKQVASASGGAFDPTVLPLVKLWGFRGGTVAVPDSTALAAVLRRVDYRLLEVEEARGRARLMAPGMEVDLGGIAKGYALDSAAAAMRAAGAVGGMIDFGGNILVFGRGPEQQVGIVDPDRDDMLLASVPLTDAAAATSGQYERYLTIGDRRYGHILDPRSGWPVPAGVSATVVAEQAMLADALATAAVVLGPESGLDLLERTPGVEGIVAVADGRGGFDLASTSGFVSSPESP